MKTFKNKSDLDGLWQKAIKKPIPINCIQIHEKFQVETLEGVMQGKPGDWLIEGVEGELYACDSGIFEKTYDLKH